MGDKEGAVVKVVSSMSALDGDAWDRCANPDPAIYNPFVSHTFLEILERSGAVAADTGWQPQHLALMDGEDPGNIVACMPCYLKSHSQGEYVFDYNWADAYERAGGDYYPKLQCAVPFTPVPGPRLLAAPGPDQGDRIKLLGAAAIQLTKRLDISSLHVTFLDSATWKQLGDFSFLRRIDQQFHWTNNGYETFDNFLATLSSRKRKTVRKERATAASSELEISHVTGRDITESDWDAMYQFYLDTGMRKWGQPYLNREFFSLLGQEMADQCLLMFAKRDEIPVAGALHMIGGDCLYGRYWGANEHHPCMHFELCYYQAIDYAITHGLPRVEAGAQGEHKLTRGYMPTTTYSLHWFTDPNLQDAVENFLDKERRYVKRTQQALADYGPYKKSTC